MTDSNQMWETLVVSEEFRLRRAGRFVVADLLVPHRVLSTSARHGGQAEDLGHLVNHQSCEGAAHHTRHLRMTDARLERYHDDVCAEAGVPAETSAVMGTAANMNYSAIVREADHAVVVTAVVTAGVQGNATSAGEPATWRELNGHIEKVPAHAGTINTMVFINQPVTPAD
jgi:hypothetical protein